MVHEPTVRAELEGVDAATSEVLAVARVILAAATKDGVAFDVANIAAETGLAVEQVRSICASPTYQAALRTQFLTLASHALTNGARAMDAIIQNVDSNPTHKVAAYRALVETIRAFDKSGGKPPEADPGDEYEEWLEKQKRKRHAGTGRTRVDPQAEQGQGD